MESTPIQVSYNRSLRPLEQLLKRVQRPGDFFVQGALELALPRVEVEGVGLLSFPVPAAQVRALIGRAKRAPYGRGAETIVDATVRNTWQLSADTVRMGGRSWNQNFQQILTSVTRGLGCANLKVTAELYKLLVYEKGGFFKPHRDTEKAKGMFGSLVLVLPTAHQGGALVVRHAGRAVSLNLSGGDTSEITFAAFYADCEHEVKPVTSGYRVCLVYNLVQHNLEKKQRQRLSAPAYDAEVAAAAKMLQATFKGERAPTKLAWLLEHQYSPAGISFAGLKGVDAARAQVLRRAAEMARCAVHLAIAHIEESGAAEVEYYLPYRSGWDDDFSDDDEAVEHEDFEVVEVSDSRTYLDQWIADDDRAVDYGALPMQRGELLPAGALNDEKPDEQRVTEATGNEGATFERAYHRAALVFWPSERFNTVLLQAGVGAAMPYLAERVQAWERRSAGDAERRRVLTFARRIVRAWESRRRRVRSGMGRRASRREMLALLGRLGDSALLERFIGGVITRLYNGRENEALATQTQRLNAEAVRRLFVGLIRERVSLHAAACVDLLSRLVPVTRTEPAAKWKATLRDVAKPIVAALPELQPHDPTAPHARLRAHRVRTIDAGTVADLLNSLAALKAKALREQAVSGIMSNTRVFDPGTVLVPALELLQTKQPDTSASDAGVERLWRHAADALLARSEFPPEPPADWRQNITVRCSCADCRELQAFARDGRAQVHRFRVKKERRQHLHRTIDGHKLDMTHVTERRGSPQTLVCTKTNESFEASCEQHGADVAALLRLAHLVADRASTLAGYLDRIADAGRRTPRPFSLPTDRGHP